MPSNSGTQVCISACITVGPWNGTPGYACCPRAENVKVRPADWELIECPECGAECYVTPAHREILKTQPNIKFVCTACALRLGSQDAKAGVARVR